MRQHPRCRALVKRATGAECSLDPRWCPTLVHLVGALSNPRAQLARASSVSARPARPRQASATPTVKRMAKFDAAQRAEVVALHQGGSTVPQLAKRFGAHGQTIRELLVAEGQEVPIARPRSLSDEQLEKACELRRSGLTVAAVAARVGGSESSVRRALKIRRL